MKLRDGFIGSLRGLGFAPTNMAESKLVNLERVFYSEFGHPMEPAMTVQMSQFWMLAEFPKHGLPSDQVMQHEVSDFALRSTFWLAVKQEYVEGANLAEDAESAEMFGHFQSHLTLMLALSFGGTGALAILMNGKKVDFQQGWAIFEGNFVIACTQEEWETLYRVKKAEMAWAVGWHERKFAMAKLQAEAAMASAGIKLN